MDDLCENFKTSGDIRASVAVLNSAWPFSWHNTKWKAHRNYHPAFTLMLKCFYNFSLWNDPNDGIIFYFILWIANGLGSWLCNIFWKSLLYREIKLKHTETEKKKINWASVSIIIGVLVLESVDVRCCMWCGWSALFRIIACCHIFDSCVAIPLIHHELQSRMRVHKCRSVFFLFISRLFYFMCTITLIHPVDSLFSLVVVYVLGWNKQANDRNVS